MRCGTALWLILAGLHASVSGAEEPAAVATATPAPVKSYLFSFWIGKKLEAALLAEGDPDVRRIDPRVRELGDRPCGGDALARVGRIPSEGDGYLVPDVVQEVGADHRVTRTWVIPIEFWPIGLEGDRVLVTSGRGERPARYWIGLDRRIQQDDQAADDHPQSEACPAEAEAKLPESAYRICVVLKDRKTGKAHRLAFEGVCT